MSVISVERDYDDLSITLTAEFDVSQERVWQLFADPRQLERWWGPPGYPATFTDHDLRPGGRVVYYMTSPEGEKLLRAVGGRVGGPTGRTPGQGLLRRRGG